MKLCTKLFFSSLLIALGLIIALVVAFPNVFLQRAALMPITITATGAHAEDSETGGTAVAISSIITNGVRQYSTNIVLSEGWSLTYVEIGRVIFSEEGSLELMLPPGNTRVE